MSQKKLHESLKIKEDDRFPSRVSGYCNWESIRLIKSILSPKQLDLFRATCFGHFLDVSDMVLSGQFCHHILLRECHVRDVDDTPSTFWFYVGNEVIRFSAVEFCLVTGLTIGDSSESPSNISKHMDKRLHQSYFQDGKVHVKVFANWFRNLGPNNNVNDNDMVKLALILFLEMTLVGKDDRNAIQYWALQLVDDLDAFNNFPWGTFINGRTFDSLSTCLVGRDDKYKERLESPAKWKTEKYNVYGFVTSFQVWAIEAIPKWAMLGHASRVNNVTPRILNWKCTGTPSYVELYDNIFKYKNLTISKFLVPSDEEVTKLYWAGIDQSHFPIDPMIVSPEECDCGVDDDDYEDDVHEDIDNVEGDAEKKMMMVRMIYNIQMLVMI
ncbi:hypothetical protein Dsin_022454 [Dipteronia sinensis]|uniref:DUF1985 domain-containing protein n=1 Tax=Dipteronia sinensis TaxID=43782 RepID=A0AAE0A1L4_9ROSI|nr:hypothetical protein Dsin_022454 [Dipteronia sinensis]